MSEYTPNERFTEGWNFCWESVDFCLTELLVLRFDIRARARLICIRVGGAAAEGAFALISIIEYN
jgi:hypothetical protein